MKVSEFTINKGQKSTNHKQQQSQQVQQCIHCEQNIVSIKELKNRQIKLCYQNQCYKAKISELENENDKLKSIQLKTYQQYEVKMNQSNLDTYKKQDLESQLFEAKFYNQLLLSGKMTDNPTEHIKQKYSKLLVQNLKLQEKIMIRDKIIEEKELHPLYHYDQRICMLRKNSVHWFKKAEFQCQIVKKKCYKMKQQIKSLKQNMEISMESEVEKYNRMIGQALKGNSKHHSSIIEKDQAKIVKKKRFLLTTHKKKIPSNLSIQKEENSAKIKHFR